MNKNLWVYSLEVPQSMEADDFAFILSEVDNEGIEIQEDIIKVYLEEEQLDPFQQFLVSISIHVLEKNIVKPQNWNQIWESGFSPLYIQDILCVKADFHKEVLPTLHTIIVNPKMSFGTGHHPTTYMMLEMMNEVDFYNKSVMDCGSGTGILAIYSEILGARHILALDNDEWCYTNAIENISNNNCNNVQAVFGNIYDIIDDFEILLANIHRNYILEHFSFFQKLVKKDGLLFVSGFYKEDAHQILEKALTYDFVAHSIKEKENWCCLAFKKIK